MKDSKNESEELRRYALEIMGLDAPLAVCALIRAASDLIIEKFSSDRGEILWAMVWECFQSQQK